MHSVLHSVGPIFLIAFLGSLMKRRWLTADDFWRGLEKLSFYLLFPCVLFEHILKAESGSTPFLRLVIAAGDRVSFTSVFQGTTRYNNYIFFALGSALFDNEGLAIIATISPYMITLTNILAIIAFTYYIPNRSNLLAGQNQIAVNTEYNGSILAIVKSIITNPLIIASSIGFIFNYFQLELNPGIKNTIHHLANSALTIGLLIVGASLTFRINNGHFQQILFTSLVKLIAMPIVTWIILSLMQISGTTKSIGVLFSCLPCASSSYILSRQLGGDPETMASIITFTTLLSILSLSFIIYILG
jgi:malonate transporter